MRKDDILVLVAVTLLALLAAFPFFSNPGLPAMTDAELHIYRIAEIGYSIQQGSLYPRWAPDFYHGYGYPIFNYYAPLSYHLGYYLTLGKPENAAGAARLLFIGSIFLGAYGAYFLAKVNSSRGGGLVGSAAYCFSPYILLVNPHSRGDLAEVVALAFLPWTLYCWQKLWDRPEKSTMVWAVLFASATLLSHNLTGLSMLAILLLMAGWEWYVVKNRKSIKWIAGTALVFVLITSFFWLPFLAERNEILLDVAGDGHYDFRNHFVRFRELLSFVKRFDYRDATMAVPFTAGVIQVLLGLAGSIASLFLGKQKTQFYIFLSILFLFLMTPLSLPVWEYLPGLAFFQFPWRFLGPLAVAMVPLAACSTEVVKLSWPNFHNQYPRVTPTLNAILVGIIIVCALPALYPIPWESGFGKITKLSIIQAELQGRWRGTTSTNDFVPATVDMLPNPAQAVIDSYSNPPVDRVNRYTLPDNTSVTILQDQSNHYAVSTEQSFILRLFLFYFPGWRVYIDDIEHPIEIAHPEGFITVEIPEGEHNVLVKFENSAIRSLSWWLSAVGLILGVRALGFAKLTYVPETIAEQSQPVQHIFDLSVVLVLSILIIILCINAFILKPGQMMYFASEANTADPADHQVYAEFGQQIALLGYDIIGRSSKGGQTFEIQLYLQAVGPVTETFQSFIHVMSSNGQILTQSDHLNPGGYPTNLWTPDKYIRDRHVLTIPKHTPPGSYPINIGLYSLSKSTRLDTVDPRTGRAGSFVTLENTVEIRR